MPCITGYTFQDWYSFILEDVFKSPLNDFQIVPVLEDSIGKRVKRRRKESSAENSSWSVVGIQNDNQRRVVYVHPVGWGEKKALLASILDLTNLTHLYLRGSTITELPPSISRLQNLKLIDIEGSMISELPEEIGNLRNLLVLNLSCTRLRRLPDEIGDLTNLKELYLNYTQIEVLPGTIWNLVNLEKLYLPCRNTIVIPPSIGDLRRLKSLDLSHTFIERLPDTIGNLTSLINMRLHSSTLKSIPPSLAGLENLLSLDLCYSGILSLPEEISNLAKLKFLNLGWTKIRSIPSSIGRLKNLERLLLGHTKNLIELPEEIGDLTSLEYLSVEESGITSLPDSIQRLPGPWVIRVFGAGFFRERNDPTTVGQFLLNLAQDCPSLVDISHPVDLIDDDEEDYELIDDWLYGVVYGVQRHWIRVIWCYNNSILHGKNLHDSLRLFERAYFELGRNRAKLRKSIQTPELWPHALRHAERAFDGGLHYTPVKGPDSIYQLLLLKRDSFLNICIDRNARQVTTGTRRRELNFSQSSDESGFGFLHADRFH